MLSDGPCNELSVRTVTLTLRSGMWSLQGVPLLPALFILPRQRQAWHFTINVKRQLCVNFIQMRTTL